MGFTRGVHWAVSGFIKTGKLWAQLLTGQFAGCSDLKAPVCQVSLEKAAFPFC